MCQKERGDQVTLLNDVKETLSNWESILCSWIKWFDSIDMSTLFKFIYKIFYL